MNKLVEILDAEERQIRRRPLPKWCEPMLATLIREGFSDREWIYEPKLDGIRCLAFRVGRKVSLFSRNRIRLDSEFPEISSALATQNDVDSIRRKGIHWVEPRLVAQIAFTEWTSAGKLRHPRYLGLRSDKNPSEIVRETPISRGHRNKT